MSSMREIEWEAPLLEPRRDSAFEREIRKRVGRAPESMRYLMASRWAAEVLAAFHEPIFRQVQLEPGLAQKVSLVVARDQSCRFCFAATRAILKVMGFGDHRISSLESDFAMLELTDNEKLALEFARKVSRANPPPGAADRKSLLEAGFEELEIKELALLVAVQLVYNRVSTLIAMPPETMEQLPDRWFVRLLRPLAANWLSGLYKQASLQPLSPEQRFGPFSELTNNLDGLPAAKVMREAIDRALSSEVLPLRAKLWVFAVVSRGLNAGFCEREAFGLLLDQGLSSEQVENGLAHLSDPAMTEIEGAIVPFARETVRYEPATIQRRAKAIQALLDEEVFVELVMVVALANAIARLDFLCSES